MVIRVGMAALAVAREPDSLKTIGLGSCVGICLYEPFCKIAGLAHIMLPTSVGMPDQNEAKYADTAIPRLLQLMVEAGAKTPRIWAKLAGGAQMFSLPGGSDLMKIGPRNVDATHVALASAGISVVAEDTGGNCGRTIELSITDGSLIIHTAKRGVYTL